MRHKAHNINAHGIFTKILIHLSLRSFDKRRMIGC